MKTKLPAALIYARLLMGFALILFSANHIAHYQVLAIILLTAGLLTDIFDGIIARQLQVSTVKLRRLDSTVDQLFFLSVAVATYLQCPDFFREHAIKLILLSGLEGLTYLVCFLKFKREVATHSIGAKIWTLFLFATLVQVMVQCQSTVLFNLCFYIGMLTRLEIIIILLILREWTSDVPTFYHSIRLRQNKTIKRYKLFNG